MRGARDARVRNVTALVGSSFTLDLFPEAVASPNFRRKMGEVDHEVARLILLFLGDMWRWSVLSTPTRRCTCGASLHSEHFFSCPAPDVKQRVEWRALLSMGRRGEWLEFTAELKECLQVWSRVLDMKPTVLEAIIS